jgi:hypothetical protein
MPTRLRDRLGTVGLAVSFGLLLLVGVTGPSAARPGLGPRGWAPGDLPWSLSPAVVTGSLWVAYAVGAAAVGLRLWGDHLATRAESRLSGESGDGTAPSSRLSAARWGLPVALGVLALLTSPFGSADHTNYAAYGRIVTGGGDPYLTPPSGWDAGDPVTSRVEPPWTGTVSIYGPFTTLLHAGASLVGGANLRQTVWVWQLVVVVAWLAVRWLLLRAGADQRRTDVLWTLNPLVFGVGVMGVHVDLVAAALALAAVVLASRSPLLAGAVGGLAVSAKVTCGLAGLALLVAWGVGERRAFASRAARLLGGAAAVAVPLHLWAGPHVFDQLDRARRSISLATPWRLVYEALLGPLASPTARDLVTVLSVVAMAGLAVLLARATRADRRPAVGVVAGVPAGEAQTPSVTAVAARWTVVLGGAYVLAAPYSLPWYDLLVWAFLPMVAAGVVDGILLLRLGSAAMAYVPGRVVGMTPGVERLTLGVRRRVVPWVGLGSWLWLVVVSLVAGRGSRRRPAPRP